MNNAVNNMNPHLSRFGLEREPFSNSADDGFFLLDSDRAQRLNMLYHLVQNSEALLLISGIEGSGKTSLLQKFLAMGNETWRYCLIRANAMMNPEQMLRHIAEGFGLEPDGINFNTALDTLKSRFIELHRSGLTALLVVDDAHELPAASLTVIMKLSEMRDEDEGLIRIIMFSEPQIMDMLSSPELSDVRHRITHTLEMPKLNEQQTADYINYRLSVAGLDGKSPFSRGKLKKIHRLSHGIPAMINEQANAMLHGGDSPSTGKPENTASLTGKVNASLAIVGLLAVAGLATYFVMEDALHDFFSADKDKTVAQLELPKQKKPVKISTDKTVSVKDESGQPSKTDVIEATKQATPAQQSEPPVNKFAITNQPAEKTADSVASANTPQVEAAKPADIKTVEPKPLTATPVTETTKPAVKPVLRTETASSTPTVTPTDKTAIKAAAVKKPVDWLASQNRNHFTLQLMGSRSKTSVEGFSRQHKLGKQAAVIKTLHQGGEWYVLVYGSYSTKEKARAAIPKLPASLKKSSPWPRKIGDLRP